LGVGFAHDVLLSLGRHGLRYIATEMAVKENGGQAAVKHIALMNHRGVYEQHRMVV